MDVKKLGVVALVAGVAVAVVPWLLPTGPNASFDPARLLESGRWVVGALLVFAGGLLTAMTPCVYPLIPITVSVFGARKAEGRGKSLMLTSSYILGMGLVFSALGMLAAQTGQAFGSLLGHPAVVTGLAVFLLVLASSMFGAFELALPSSLQTRLTHVGGAGLAGAFLMGSVSGFLTAPCTGPALAGLLAFVAKTANIPLGAGLLFIYAMGIGLPFFLIGVFALRLPRGGEWMEWVKSVLGILLVAMAFFYVRDGSPWVRDQVKALGAQVGQVPGATLASVVTVLGVLAGAVHRSFKSGAREFALKALGVLLVVGAMVLRSGALDARPVGELWVRMGLAEPPVAPSWQWHHVMPTRQATFSPEAFDKVLALAKAEGRPVLVDFFADWCAACKELDRLTYPAPEVISQAAEGRFLNIKIDATHSEDALDALLERFGVEGLPTVAFVSAQGEVLTKPRITGFLKPSPFVEQMKQARCTAGTAC